jgi:hypothetical protein
MTASLESAQRLKIDPVLFDSKLIATIAGSCGFRNNILVRMDTNSSSGHQEHSRNSRASSKVSVVG